MGKTTLCRAIVQGIDRRTVTSLVLDPLESLDDLLMTMLVDFGVMAREDLAGAAQPRSPADDEHAEHVPRFARPAPGGAVVVIDEAQHVPIDPCSPISSRLLVPGTPGASVLQLVLVGQPSLTARLKHPDLRGLDRERRRSALDTRPAGPPTKSSGYVAHRLSVAGARTPRRVRRSGDRGSVRAVGRRSRARRQPALRSRDDARPAARRRR